MNAGFNYIKSSLIMLGRWQGMHGNGINKIKWKKSFHQIEKNSIKNLTMIFCHWMNDEAQSKINWQSLFDLVSDVTTFPLNSNNQRYYRTSNGIRTRYSKWINGKKCVIFNRISKAFNHFCHLIIHTTWNCEDGSINTPVRIGLQRDEI